MKKYKVSGMSCAACSSRVEKAVNSLEGVTSCNVNLLTNSLVVEGNVSDREIISAVENAGYEAELFKNVKTASSESKESNEERSLKKTKNRLIYSVIILIPLMYLSMGKMLNLPTPEFLRSNMLLAGTIQMVLSAIIMFINRAFFINAYKSLRHRNPNMDVLVSMGSLASFLYSVCLLFEIAEAHLGGNISMAHKLAHSLYFESAAMILTLISVGKLLEEHSKGKTTNAIKSLVKLAPRTATVIRNGEELVIPTEEVLVNDIFIVNPGKSIPADGIVIEGHSAVDESALTGESLPKDKNLGDKVSAATINKSGYLKCRATDVGEDTTLSKIIKMIEDSSATKAPIARIADRVSGVFVPIVLLIAVITFVIWMVLGKDIGFALSKGVCVLVISCPCALGLATPVAIMVGNGVGAKYGILFKNATALEQAGKIKIAAIDKTGTITEGNPSVTDIIPISAEENELLEIACALEQNSEHPFAKAILEECKQRSISPEKIDFFENLPGAGVKGIYKNVSVFGGNIRLIESKIKPDEKVKESLNKLSQEGKTPLMFAKEEEILGIIAVADVVKADSKDAVTKLRQMGIMPVMITGDNRNTATVIATQVGIESIIADVLPDGKEQAIQNLRKNGIVMMIGDGINDAPALTSADIGTALGAGTDIAIDSADIILTKNSLSDVVSAILLSRAVLKNIKENLFWAFCYNVIGIPLAAGLWIPFTGWELSPMFGAAAMSLSSFCVITNALRLNFFKPNTNKKEIKEMETVIKIEGMMCAHCEARIKTSLEEVEGVTEVIASHKTGEAIVKADKEIPFDTLKSIVEAQGYKVL